MGKSWKSKKSFYELMKEIEEFPLRKWEYYKNYDEWNSTSDFVETGGKDGRRKNK